VTRREESSEATRLAILAEARSLFARDGYESTSVEAIASNARCTTGALYHHFGGKKELFRAVVDLVMTDLMSAAGALLMQETDPWKALRTAIGAVLDRSQSIDVRIAFIEAPAVLGLDGWREIEKPHSTKVLQDVLKALIASGTITPRPLPVLVAVLRGAINEAAMVVAENPTSAAVRKETGELIDALLEGLKAKKKKKR